jgi:hypothetical protein
MQLLEITPNPAELRYALERVQLAREHAGAALAQVAAPPRPGVMPAYRVGLDACYEAAEHLHDALQVDVPADLAEQVRHALTELEHATDLIIAAGRRREATPAATATRLTTAIDWLEQLEHRLRAGEQG